MGGKKTVQMVRDMVLSLVLIALAAGVVYLFLPHDDSKDPIQTVNYDVELDGARRAAPYPVAAPQGLPDGWRATSVRYNGASDEGATWHLGFLTPEREYVAVEQSDGRVAPFVSDVTQQATKTGRTERAGGESWDTYHGSKYNALVHRDTGVTTVVTGTAPHEDLTRMAASLKAKKGSTKGFR